MKCKEIREMIPDLAAGMDSMTPEAEEHLHSCAECSNDLKEIRGTMALLDEWEAPELTPYFNMRLKARLREEIANQPASWLQWMRKPALAISLAVLMVASITLFRGGGSSTPALPGPGGNPALVSVSATPGTAVGDLQSLDRNHDLYSDFDVLDDLTVQQDVTANP